MPGGRPPKPTALKLLEGTARRDRINASEPQPPLLLEARPPAWLKGRGRRAWKELAPVLTEMRVLTVGDRAALMLLCDVYAEFMDARDAVRKHGQVYTMAVKGGGYMLMPRPEVSIAADAWRRASAMMQQFGLTPASRSKVSAKDAIESDPFEEFLRGGRASS